MNLLENMHAYKQTKIHQPKKNVPPAIVERELCRVSRDRWVVLKKSFVRAGSFLGVEVDEVWMAFPSYSESQWLKLLLSMFRLIEFNIFY